MAIARNDVVETDNATPVKINFLDNDSSTAEGNLSVIGLTLPANGNLAFNADSTMTYTPKASFTGEDTFTYTVRDRNGASDTATVLVRVNAADLPPIANDDVATTDAEQAVAVNVLGNDFDPDGGPIFLTGLTPPANGTLGFGADQRITYRPRADFVGEDRFSYTIKDSSGKSDSADVTITVRAQNAAPQAVNDNVITAVNQPVTIDILGNDSDPDGDPLLLTALGLPGEGSLSLNAGQSITYRPRKDFIGEDSFSYAITDGKGGSNTATVAISVRSQDLPLLDDVATTVNDTPVRINVLANDSGSGTGAASVGSLILIGLGNPENGTVTPNADQSVTYRADPGFSGQDSFTYTVRDQNGNRGTASVTINVDSDPRAPIAGNFTVAAFVNTPLRIDPVAASNDPDAQPLTATITGNPQHGTLEADGSGAFTYTPNDLFEGEDSFTYLVRDPDGLESAGTVTVKVGLPGLVENWALNRTFNGTSDAVVELHDIAYQLDAGTLAIAFTPDRLDGTRTLISKDHQGLGTGGHTQIMLSGGAVEARLQSDGASYQLTSTSGLIAVGAVNHIVLRFGPGGMALFVNGILAASNDFTGGMTANKEPWLFGASQMFSTPGQTTPRSDFFAGTINQVQLFNSELSALKIAVLTALSQPVTEAVADTIEVVQGEAKSFDPKANDLDPSGGGLTITAVQSPTPLGAAVTINGTGSATTLTYTAPASRTGADSFAYTVRDSLGREVTATVNVNVIDVPSFGVKPVTLTTYRGRGVKFQPEIIGASDAIPLWDFADSWTDTQAADWDYAGNATVSFRDDQIGTRTLKMFAWSPSLGVSATTVITIEIRDWNVVASFPGSDRNGIVNRWATLGEGEAVRVTSDLNGNLTLIGSGSARRALIFNSGAGAGAGEFEIDTVNATILSGTTDSWNDQGRNRILNIRARGVHLCGHLFDGVGNGKYGVVWSDHADDVWIAWNRFTRLNTSVTSVTMLHPPGVNNGPGGEIRENWVFARNSYDNYQNGMQVAGPQIGQGVVGGTTAEIGIEVSRIPCNALLLGELICDQNNGFFTESYQIKAGNVRLKRCAGVNGDMGTSIRTGNNIDLVDCIFVDQRVGLQIATPNTRVCNTVSYLSRQVSFDCRMPSYFNGSSSDGSNAYDKAHNIELAHLYIDGVTQADRFVIEVSPGSFKSGRGYEDVKGNRVTSSGPPDDITLRNCVLNGNNQRGILGPYDNGLWGDPIKEGNVAINNGYNPASSGWVGNNRGNDPVQNIGTERTTTLRWVCGPSHSPITRTYTVPAIDKNAPCVGQGAPLPMRRDLLRDLFGNERFAQPAGQQFTPGHAITT